SRHIRISGCINGPYMIACKGRFHSRPPPSHTAVRYPDRSWDALEAYKLIDHALAAAQFPRQFFPTHIGRRPGRSTRAGLCMVAGHQATRSAAAVTEETIGDALWGIIKGSNKINTICSGWYLEPCP